jgi:uncharacterized membrane protein YedE/YeeE
MSDDGKGMSETSRELTAPAILLILTAVTGVVDAVSFLGMGRIFTANMTGNLLLLAFALSGVPGLSVTRSLSALIAFLSGALLGGRLRSHGLARFSASATLRCPEEKSHQLMSGAVLPVRDATKSGHAPESVLIHDLGVARPESDTMPEKRV